MIFALFYCLSQSYLKRNIRGKYYLCVNLRLALYQNVLYTHEFFQQI